MTSAFDQLRVWMKAPESEHLEFKEAKNRYDFEELVKYCAALANEGGGRMVLGVTDRPPRKVVGSQAFPDLERTKAGLIERLRLRIEAVEIHSPEGRVVVFHIPSRPVGVPIDYKGAYWMRGGETLVPMTPDLLKRIFAESEPDFSAQVCPRATVSDLDPSAVENFRAMWRRQSGNVALESLPTEQLLADAELMEEGRVTYAGLILLGTHRALGKHLAQAEVIFEYRSSEVTGPAQQRIEFRQGYFLFLDELWNLINLRNDLQHYQHRLVMYRLPTFNEQAVRETLLNAVSHRDYRLPGSVFVRQYPRKVQIESPGGFPPSITPENILWKQAPRNRRIAEAFARCGLVERAGQGMNRIYESCIKESKLPPDFAGTDDYQVCLTLHGEVQDPRFLRFLEEVSRETVASFTTQDLLVLDLIHREQKIPRDLQPRLVGLEDAGVVEAAGRGKFILSRRLYSFLGQKGVYTRKKGLDRETHKALLLKHLEDHPEEGSPLEELMQVLPALSRSQVQKLLGELRTEGQVHYTGRTNRVRWFPGPTEES